MLKVFDFFRVHWFELLQVLMGLIVGGNLAQQFTLKNNASLAGKLARFTLALLFSALYYALFFYVSNVFAD